MTFVKGQSGNPKGRPKGTLGLSERIRQAVDPQRIIDVALAIADNPEAAERDRLMAVKFLADHGWSKPVIQHEDVSERVALDFSKMPLSELKKLAADEPDGEPEPG